MSKPMDGMYTGTRWARLAYRPANIGLSTPVFGTTRTGTDIFNHRAHSKHIRRAFDGISMSLNWTDMWKDDLVITKDFNLSNCTYSDEWETTTLWDGYTANQFPQTDTDLNELSTSSWMRRANSAVGGLFQATLDTNINPGEPSTSGPQNQRYYSHAKPYSTVPDPSKGYGATRKMLEYVPIKFISDDLDDKVSPISFRIITSGTGVEATGTLATLHFCGPPGTYQGIIPQDTNPATDDEYVSYGTGYYILTLSQARLTLFEQVRNINYATETIDNTIEIVEVASCATPPNAFADAAGIDGWSVFIERGPITATQSGFINITLAGDYLLGSIFHTTAIANGAVASNLSQGLKKPHQALHTFCPGGTKVPNIDGMNKQLAVGISSAVTDCYVKLSYVEYFEDGFILDTPIGLPAPMGGVSLDNEEIYCISVELNAQIPTGTTLTAKVYTEQGLELKPITIAGYTNTKKLAFSCHRYQSGVPITTKFSKPQVEFTFTSSTSLISGNRTPRLWSYTLTAGGAYNEDADDDWFHVDESNPHAGITKPDHKLTLNELVSSAEDINNVRAEFTLIDPYNHYSLFRTCGCVEVVFQIGTKTAGTITWNNVFWGITTSVEAHERIDSTGEIFWSYQISCRTVVEVLKKIASTTAFLLVDQSTNNPLKITDIVRTALNYLGLGPGRVGIPDYAIRIYLSDSATKDQYFAGNDLWAMIQKLVKEYIPYYFDIDHQQRKVVLRKFTNRDADPLINFDTPGAGVVADNRIPVKYDSLTGVKVPYIKGSYSSRIRQPEFNYLIVTGLIGIGTINLSLQLAVDFNPESFYITQQGAPSPVQPSFGPNWMGTCIPALLYQPVLSTLFGSAYSGLASKWICRRLMSYAGYAAKVSNFVSALILIPNTDDGITVGTHWRLLRYQDPIYIRSVEITFLIRDTTHEISKLALAKTSYNAERIWDFRDPLTP